jgi:hypothetical protein
MIASGRHAANRYALMVVVASLLASVVRGQEPIVWKTGPALETQLKQQYNIQWQDRPLRPVLTRLARETAVATFLDRRIDPDQPLSLEVTDIPLNQLHDRIASAVGASVCRVSAVKYIGPSGVAGKLPSVAAQRRSEAAKMPSDLRARLLKQQPLSWPELIEPRDLVAALAEEAGLSVNHPESIPHDLWPAVDLPSLAWTDRLSLVLAGFNLTFEIDAAKKTLAFKPL